MTNLSRGHATGDPDPVQPGRASPAQDSIAQGDETQGILDAVQVSVERSRLARFIEESNHIEGILRGPTPGEFDAHARLLGKKAISIAVLADFVWAVAARPPRFSPGLNVRVGGHVPPPGGPEIERELLAILTALHAGETTPYETHRAYEALHPFMDGNGRSGRALWAWQMQREGQDPFALPFLHRWYYQSLDGSR